MTTPYNTGTPSAGVAPYPLALQASTGIPGFALQNATPNIISWTAPNDGLMHRFAIYGEVSVTVAETGGAVSVSFTDPGGNARVPGPQLDAGGHGVGSFTYTARTILIAPGSAVVVTQSSALTLGAATVWAEIWGS